MASDAHQKIVWLYVTMNEMFAMQKLQTADHLFDQHQHRFNCEMSRTKIKQIFQRRTEQIHYQHVEISFGTKVTDARNSHAARHQFVQFVLVQQLRMTGVDAFHFDGHLFAAQNADAQVNVTETAAANFPDDPVLGRDDEFILATSHERFHRVRVHVVGRRRGAVGGLRWLCRNVCVCVWGWRGASNKSGRLRGWGERPFRVLSNDRWAEKIT